METGSTKAFLLENEPHAYAAATATLLAASLSFEVPPLLPSPSLSFLFLWAISIFCVKDSNFVVLVCLLCYPLSFKAFVFCAWDEATSEAERERERKERGDKELCKIQQWPASVAVVAVTFLSHYYYCCCCVLSFFITRLYKPKHITHNRFQALPPIYIIIIIFGSMVSHIYQ